MMHWIKDLLLPFALLVAMPCRAAAQIVTNPGPMATALAGAVTARVEGPWCTEGNPAAISGIAGRSLMVSYAPSAIGIEGYYEGTLRAALPLDTAIAFGVVMESVGVKGYREVTGRAVGSMRLPAGVAFGLVVSLHSLAIDGYGSALAPSVDLGAIAWLTDRIRFGTAITNAAQSRIAGTDLPQRLAIGFAFDIGHGTTLSIDAMQELRRGARIIVGFSTSPAEGFVLRTGAGTAPGQIALGAGYDRDGLVFEYGGSYTMPVGFRHVIGVGVRW